MKIRPYITFDGECNEAIELYKRAFKTDTIKILRFSDLPPNPAFAIPEELKNRIMQASLKFGDNFIRLSDRGPQQPLNAPESERVTIAAEMSVEQVKCAFDVLAEQGRVTMPLEKTFYSPLAGDVVDKFGVMWRLVAEDVTHTTGVETDIDVPDSTKALELNENTFELKRDDENISIEIQEQKAELTLAYKEHATMATTAEVMGRGLNAVYYHLDELGKQPIGVPYAAYFNCNGDFTDFDLELGFPVAEEVSVKDNLYMSKTYEGKVVTATHKGSYETLETTFHAIMRYAEENKLELADIFYEYYFNDPSLTPEDELLTKIVIPLK